MDKEKIFLNVNNQIIIGFIISTDMWYLDITVESGPKELIDIIKSQNIQLNITKGRGIFAKWKTEESSEWHNGLILGMTDEILHYHMYFSASEREIKKHSNYP